MLKLIFILLIGFNASAFVPDAVSIFKKYSDTQSGQMINATFTLKDPSSNLSWKEVWQVEPAGLRVVGFYSSENSTKESPIYNFLYTSDRKITGPSGSPASLGEEFIEPLFFHGGDISSLKKFVLRLRFLPLSSFQLPVITNIKTYVPTEDPFIKVSRSNGLITLAMSQSSDLSEGNILWVDQDQFLPRKIKLASGAVVTVDNYSSRLKNYSLPGLKTYEWDQKKVESTLISAQTYKESKLNIKEISTDPSPSILYEFMKKFR